MKTFRFRSDNLDETLFEHRNKAYGAYELRRTYDARVIKSFLFSLSLIALLFGAPILIQSLFKKPIAVPKEFSVTIFEFGKKPEADLKKNASIPLSGKIPKQRLKEDAPFIVKKDSLVTKDENKKDTLQKISVTTTLVNSSTIDTAGDETRGTIVVKRNSGGGTTSASLEPLSIAAVEKIPQFPGGESSMLSFLQKNIRYKEEAKAAKVTGRVFASFIINSKGEVEAIKILRSLGFGLDEEVIRVLGIMPKWEPGYYGGKAVSTILNIPVSFNLIQ